MHSIKNQEKNQLNVKNAFNSGTPKSFVEAPKNFAGIVQIRCKMTGHIPVEEPSVSTAGNPQDRRQKQLWRIYKEIQYTKQGKREQM